MIKKILLTLLVLIVIVVGGIICLVVFVDPNNFRGFISNTVKDKTGYELTINGDLRWHIWPQISILTDAVRLDDTGAKEPLLTADNMRLDVELWPLFSKELVVKNVLIKSAVINITDQSKGHVAKGTKPTTTVNQTQTTPQQAKESTSWTFELNKLDIVDSTVVYQQNQDIISFRDTNVSISQNGEKSAVLSLNGSVNRDQQDFIYSLNANVDLAQFPKQAVIDLTKLNYNYKGVGVPAGGLKGDLQATFKYQQSPFTLDTNNFKFSINGNKLDGKLKANLANKPYFEAILTSEQFDLTPFLTNTQSGEHQDSKDAQTAPVVTTKMAKGNELGFLKSFDAKFNLTIKQILANKVVMNNFVIDANNKDGVATLNKVNLDLANGNIAANGVANGKQDLALIKLSTKASDIDLGVLFEQLQLAKNFKGLFNANGQISTNTIDPQKVMSAITGDLAVRVDDARLENLNIQNIIQAGVSQYTKEALSDQQYQKYTELDEISADAKLAKGDMNLSSIKALSATLDVIGDGRIGLVKQDLDINLQVKVLSGWNGKSHTIQQLQKIAIPLQIYGTFDQLHYKLNAEKVLKEILNSQVGDKLQSELNKLKERLNNDKTSTNQQTQDTESTSEKEVKTDKEKAKELLGGLLNKAKNKE